MSEARSDTPGRFAARAARFAVPHIEPGQHDHKRTDIGPAVRKLAEGRHAPERGKEKPEIGKRRDGAGLCGHQRPDQAEMRQRADQPDGQHEKHGHSVGNDPEERHDEA